MKITLTTISGEPVVIRVRRSGDWTSWRCSLREPSATLVAPLNRHLATFTASQATVLTVGGIDIVSRHGEVRISIRPHVVDHRLSDQDRHDLHGLMAGHKPRRGQRPPGTRPRAKRPPR